MSQSSALLARAQAFHAEQFPAVLKIGPQSYAAATSGRRAQSVLEAGGFNSQPAISFWLPVAAFAQAGQPLPEENATLTCTAPAELAGDYLIAAVLMPGVVSTLTLRCVGVPQ